MQCEVNQSQSETASHPLAEPLPVDSATPHAQAQAATERLQRRQAHTLSSRAKQTQGTTKIYFIICRSQCTFCIFCTLITGNTLRINWPWQPRRSGSGRSNNYLRPGLCSSRAVTVGLLLTTKTTASPGRHSAAQTQITTDTDVKSAVSTDRKLSEVAVSYRPACRQQWRPAGCCSADLLAVEAVIGELFHHEQRQCREVNQCWPTLMFEAQYQNPHTWEKLPS